MTSHHSGSSFHKHILRLDRHNSSSESASQKVGFGAARQRARTQMQTLLRTYEICSIGPRLHLHQRRPLMLLVCFVLFIFIIFVSYDAC